MNTETRLYLALQAMYNAADEAYDQGESFNVVDSPVGKQANMALEQFEMELGPLPDWAVAHNLTDELVEGLQLFTKDGRHTGNAHIITVTTPPPGITTVYYHCITDVGNELRLTESELNSLFWPGKFISTVERIIERFSHTEGQKA